MRRITDKQLSTFKELYIDGASATKAYQTIKPNVTNGTARTMGSKLVSTLGLTMIDTLNRQGITDDKLATKLNEGLEANKTVTSHTEPDRIEPDHKTRHKYLETGLRLRGHSETKPLIDNRTVVVQLPSEVSKSD